ncbi:HAD family hydrolase [Marinobacter sp.]|uniref:HAD family hydrolase n=1 Tax=Marinobacter sp. TaxID=50741 RepID=UPI003563993A
MSSLQQYSTWVFDCDGVLLHSNRVKTDAFYRAAEPYGTDKARALVDYHVGNGGISRYIKFRTFLSDIVGRGQVDEEELDTLLQCYAGYVWDGLLSCEVAQGLERLRALTPQSSWLVVSGGDQAELRAVFAERGLAKYFDGGIFGSPDTKDEILSRTTESRVLRKPGVFVGDSRYDIEAARRAGLDFIFLSDWSESDYHFCDADLRLASISAIVRHLSSRCP